MHSPNHPKSTKAVFWQPHAINCNNLEPYLLRKESEQT